MFDTESTHMIINIVGFQHIHLCLGVRTTVLWNYNFPERINQLIYHVFIISSLLPVRTTILFSNVQLNIEQLFYETTISQTESINLLFIMSSTSHLCCQSEQSFYKTTISQTESISWLFFMSLSSYLCWQSEQPFYKTTISQTESISIISYVFIISLCDPGRGSLWCHMMPSVISLPTALSPATSTSEEIPHHVHSLKLPYQDVSVFLFSPHPQLWDYHRESSPLIYVQQNSAVQVIQLVTPTVCRCWSSSTMIRQDTTLYTK